jgi:hypothetical protein
MELVLNRGSVSRMGWKGGFLKGGAEPEEQGVHPLDQFVSGLVECVLQRIVPVDTGKPALAHSLPGLPQTLRNPRQFRIRPDHQST